MALKSGLYVTATPIGNLGDISSRAVDVLRHADMVLVEDSRVSTKLLKHLGIKQSLHPYHDHNAARVRPVVLRELKAGKAVALISDAGTPLISDPGYKLVSEARKQGIAIFSVPGPSALTASLSIAGLATDRVLFAGFLPSKQAARRKALQRDKATEATLVYYESPKRLMDAFADMADIFGMDHSAVLCRELTKMHEEVVAGSLENILKELKKRESIKGECVILLAASPPKEYSDNEVDRLLMTALKDHKMKDAAKQVAEMTGLSQRQLYQRALSLKEKAAHDT